METNLSSFNVYLSKTNPDRDLKSFFSVPYVKLCTHRQKRNASLGKLYNFKAGVYNFHHIMAYGRPKFMPPLLAVNFGICCVSRLPVIVFLFSEVCNCFPKDKMTNMISVLPGQWTRNAFRPLQKLFGIIFGNQFLDLLKYR